MYPGPARIADIGLRQNMTVNRLRGHADRLARTTILALLGALAAPVVPAAEIVVYTAKKIVTMEPSLPTATNVAVRDGHIVAVGAPKDIQPWLDQHPHRFDHRFADKVLYPGFIDPHLHPFLGATLLGQNEIIAPEDWRLPGRFIEGALDRKSYLERLTALANKGPNATEPVFTWGWNAFWHGDLNRADLDAISDSRPIVVTQRSAHEMILNSAAMTATNLGPEVEEVSHGIDWHNGRFWERGLFVADAAVQRHLGRGRDMRAGLELVADMIHRGGVTTISDPGQAPLPGTAAWENLTATLGADGVPFRTLAMAFDEPFADWPGETPLQRYENAARSNTDRIQITKSIKFLADGAMFAQYMQLGEPGYIDGHHGEWLTEPAALTEGIRPYWRAGFDVNVHVNGDKGIDAVLDTLETMLIEQPRPDIRYLLQHFGISRPDQAVRIGRLGATVSATGYYLWLLGDKYAQVGIGPDRADRMLRLGSLVRNGVKVTLHSDLPMGPVEPLLAVWSVTTRKTASNTVRGVEEALTLDQALRAITIDAAWSLRLDREIGSIVAGKKADFTVLEQDPHDVEPDAVKDIKVWGTVFEGEVFPVSER